MRRSAPARGRLVRQLLTESAVLGVASALLGAWLARLGMLGLVALAPANLPRLDEIRVDITALGFAIAIALVASILFGLAPALQASRVQLVDGLRQGGKGSSIGARGGWARNAFVVAEIALAVVLVVGAGLLARSLAALPPSTWASRRSACWCCAPRCRCAPSTDAPRATAFYRDLLPDLRALPGVTAVAAVTEPADGSRLERRLLARRRPDLEQLGVARAAGALHRRDARLLQDDGRADPARPRLHRRRSREAPRWSRSSTRRWRARRSPVRIRSAGGSSAGSTRSTS